MYKITRRNLGKIDPPSFLVPTLYREKSKTNSVMCYCNGNYLLSHLSLSREVLLVYQSLVYLLDPALRLRSSKTVLPRWAKNPARLRNYSKKLSDHIPFYNLEIVDFCDIVPVFRPLKDEKRAVNLTIKKWNGVGISRIWHSFLWDSKLQFVCNNCAQYNKIYEGQS